jgi:cell division cycle 20, cofactor of APC complex
MDVSSYLLSNSNSSTNGMIENPFYSKVIEEGVMNVNSNYSCIDENLKINRYKPILEAPTTIHDHLSSIYDKASKGGEIKRPNRTLPQHPEKILDAPDLLNDYYLNLLDWGNNGMLAVSLGQSVYLWKDGNIDQLLSCNDDDSYICSVGWSTRSNCLAVGLSTNVVQLWDCEKSQLLRTLKGHDNRVSAVSWNNCILSSGSRDSNILNHDVRIQNSVTSKLTTHTSEVCGLKWSCDGTQLASGSNDNTLMIWDLGYSNSPRHILRDHVAAVKAIAWCPWQKNLLASGGGTHDKTIKFWNTDNGNLLQSLTTSNQVCSLIWNKYEKELVSSHGFSNGSTSEVSKNHLTVWKYQPPNITMVGELKGHTDRVLHMALSPDGETVVSAGADETLRFWKLFEAPQDSKKTKQEKFFMNNLR